MRNDLWSPLGRFTMRSNGSTDGASKTAWRGDHGHARPQSRARTSTGASSRPPAPPGRARKASSPQPMPRHPHPGARRRAPFLRSATHLRREAERRVLILENPGFRGGRDRHAFAGLQLIMPGEVALRTATAAALRFIIEGSGAHTTSTARRGHGAAISSHPRGAGMSTATIGGPMAWLDGLTSRWSRTSTALHEDHAARSPRIGHDGLIPLRGPSRGPSPWRRRRARPTRARPRYQDPRGGWASRPSRVIRILPKGFATRPYHRATAWCSPPWKGTARSRCGGKFDPRAPRRGGRPGWMPLPLRERRLGAFLLPTARPRRSSVSSATSARHNSRPSARRQFHE